MYNFYDPIEWETVVESRPCTSCNGDAKKCNGMCNGMFGMGSKRRSQEEINRLKAERTRNEEDEILAKADVIRQKRGLK